MLFCLLPKSAVIHDTCIRPRRCVCDCGGTSAQLAAQSVRAAARGSALCPRYHPAWVSEGNPVGPGKDTHGTLGGPNQQFRTADSADTSQTPGSLAQSGKIRPGEARTSCPLAEKCHARCHEKCFLCHSRMNDLPERTKKVYEPVKKKMNKVHVQLSFTKGHKEGKHASWKSLIRT